MTILEQCMAARRDLPIALGRALAVAKPGAGQNDHLGRLYSSLAPADKLRCGAELYECREARRGNRMVQL